MYGIFTFLVYEKYNLKILKLQQKYFLYERI